MPVIKERERYVERGTREQISCHLLDICMGYDIIQSCRIETGLSLTT